MCYKRADNLYPKAQSLSFCVEIEKNIRVIPLKEETCFMNLSKEAQPPKRKAFFCS